MSASDGAGRADRVAITLSALCLVHCLVIPVALLAAPAVGVAVLGTETAVHWLLLGVAVPVSVYALWHGYRQHRQSLCVVLGAVGLCLMFVAVSHVAGASREVPLTLAGVVVLLVAHAYNLRSSLNGGPPGSLNGGPAGARRCAHGD